MSKLTKKSEKKVYGGIITQYEHSSTSTKTQMVFSVFFPPVPSGEKVPGLYFLSGLTCTDQNFITKGLPYASATEYGIALIVPDTSPRGAKIKGEEDNWDFGTGAGFYVDSTEDAWKNNYNMYTYVTQELPALVEENLPITSKKSVFGHSMGGHGALICYLKNPGMYESCSAFAPICNPIQCPWGEKAFSGYLGSDRQAWEAYDATYLVRNYTGPKYEILIDQGTKDDFFEKKQLLPENFVEASKAADFPVNLRMQNGYDHSYFFIQTFIGDHIRHHAEALGCANNDNCAKLMETISTPNFPVHSARTKEGGKSNPSRVSEKKNIREGKMKTSEVNEKKKIPRAKQEPLLPTVAFFGCGIMRC